ncbi:MAG: hypothetical protein WCO35_03840 [Candidatus Nomurabacteria bacterium]
MDTNNVSKGKDSLKQFLNLLEKDPNNSMSFLKLILDEFVSSAGTLAKKKLLQNLFCNEEFDVDIIIYYKLARVFNQEIQIDNIKHILQEEKDIKNIILAINFIEKETLKDKEDSAGLEILSFLRNNFSFKLA